MGDLVQRLRADAERLASTMRVPRAMQLREAADRIDALETAARAAIELIGPAYADRVAALRAVLDGELSGE